MSSLSKLQMARSLYDAIPATDFRKYSYLDPDRSTTLTVSEEAMHAG